MKIAIIGAMEEEVELLRSRIEEKETTMAGNSEYTAGKLNGADVILLKSGIGKVNAAMSTAVLLDRFKPDAVINTGSAGGFNSDHEIGTVVISSEVRHHDVDVTVFGYEHGQVPQLPSAFTADSRLMEAARKAVEDIGEHALAEGLIITGDSFMSDADRVGRVRELFPEALASEMEAAAVAQVCHQFGVPFVVIRALSDIAGKESAMSFDEFLPKAAKHSAEAVMRAVSNLQGSHGIIG